MRSPLSQATVAVFPCFLGTCCGLSLAGSGLGNRCQVLGRTKHPLGILSLGSGFSVAAQIPPRLELFVWKNRIPDGRASWAHGGAGGCPVEGAGLQRGGQISDISEDFSKADGARQQKSFPLFLIKRYKLGHPCPTELQEGLVDMGEKGISAPPGTEAPSREVLQFRFQDIHGVFSLFTLLCQEHKEHTGNNFVDITVSSPSEGGLGARSEEQETCSMFFTLLLVILMGLT